MHHDVSDRNYHGRKFLGNCLGLCCIFVFSLGLSACGERELTFAEEVIYSMEGCNISIQEVGSDIIGEAEIAGGGFDFFPSIRFLKNHNGIEYGKAYSLSLTSSYPLHDKIMETTRSISEKWVNPVFYGRYVPVHGSFDCGTAGRYDTLIIIEEAEFVREGEPW